MVVPDSLRQLVAEMDIAFAKSLARLGAALDAAHRRATNDLEKEL